MCVYEYIKEKLDEDRAISNWELSGKGVSMEEALEMFEEDEHYKLGVTEYKHSSYIYGIPLYNNEAEEAEEIFKDESQMFLFDLEQEDDEQVVVIEPSHFEIYMAEHLGSQEVINPKF